MNSLQDSFSRFALRTLEVMFRRYPARTFLGLLIGLALHWFLSSLEAISSIHVLGGSPLVSWTGCLAVGLLIGNARLLSSIFTRSPLWSEQVSDLLEIIDKSNFSEEEKRRHIRKLIGKCLDDLALPGHPLIAISEKHRNPRKNEVG